MRIFSVLVLIIALASCASWRREPAYLDFPEPPHITYQLCEIDNEAVPMICMSQHDAAALVKWFDKLQAFAAARRRLLRN